jgi:hypothetical protein
MLRDYRLDIWRSRAGGIRPTAEATPLAAIEPSTLAAEYEFARCTTH